MFQMNIDCVDDHFPDVGKMVGVGSGTERQLVDYYLSRYACYLIAQNGDPKKDQMFGGFVKKQ